MSVVPRGALPSWAVVLLFGAALVPFAVVDLPPLADLPGHLGRYHIAATLDRSPHLQRFYAYDWFLTGNLGTDLLAQALHPVLDIERFGWWVSLGIVALLVGGTFLLSRQLHGAIQPSAVLALPFVYSNMLLYGFLNYFLAVGLVLFVVAAWCRLEARPLARWLLLFAAATPIWVCHLAGWAVLVVTIGTRLLADMLTDRSRPFWRRFGVAAIAGLPLLPPVLFIAATSQGGGGLFSLPRDMLTHKAMMLAFVLSDHWFPLDLTTPIMILGLVGWGVWSKRVAADLPMLAAGLLLIGLSLLMPERILGSYFADRRVLAVGLPVALIGLRWNIADRLTTTFAALLFCLRMALTTVGWAEAHRDFRSHLAALDAVPRGARILVQVIKTCDLRPRRYEPPLEHLASLAIIRRDAFVNSQWQTPGAHGLRAIYNRDTAFYIDPSQRVDARDCPGEKAMALDRNLARFPRDRFDFVWILGTRRSAFAVPADLETAYADGNSALYRVAPAQR